MSTVLGEAVLSALTAASFGLLYQVSGSNLLIASGIGGVAWLLAHGMGNATLLSDAVGALVVGGLAEFAAHWRREPVSVFVVPAIIVFVPGYLVYQSMVAFLKGHFVAGLQTGLTAIMAAGALGIGLALATAIIRPLVRGRQWLH
ncbi:MAG: threonine/serine exporter family protein [Thermaerobacter sp.]|nr:threonine/serine exporter family protein [Thermaerobacter sp.]